MDPLRQTSEIPKGFTADATPNQNQITQAIHLLKDKIWVEAHRTEAAIVCNRLESISLSVEAKKSYMTLLESNPSLFPQVSIEIDGHKTVLPRAKLIFQSEKFSKMLQSSMNESRKNEIYLTTNGIDSSIIQEFLKYLSNGELTLTGENALSLLYLAREHDLTLLMKDCINFLTKNLKTDSFKTIYENARKLDVKDLVWNCLLFYRTKNEKLKFIKVIESLNPEEKKLLELVARGEKNHGIYIQENRSICVLNSTCQNSGLSILQEIQNSAPPIRLLIFDPLMDDNDLKKLSKILKNINELISLEVNNKITTIPSEWQINLLDLKCPKVTSIEALLAKKIVLIGGSSLKSIKAPVAENIFFGECSALTSIEAPLAKKIVLRDCSSLTSIKTLAENITFTKCSALKSIEAPLAKNIDLTECSSLISVYAPLAEKFSSNDCPSLTNIETPSAEKKFFMTLTPSNHPRNHIYLNHQGNFY